MNWRDEYTRLAEAVTAAAPRARPMLAGFSTCVDRIHPLTGRDLDALAEAPEPLADLASEIMHRITHGSDGEVFADAPHLDPVLRRLLSPPVRHQVGGTGSQAAWALATLGVPTIIPLADRSADQLAVLHPRIGLCAGAGVRPVARTPPIGTPTKPPHTILEYTAGTRWRGGTVPRSSRIIVRLAADGVERDDDFAELSPELARTAGAGLMSGLNGIADDDATSHRWVDEVVDAWRAAGVPTIHLELAEYSYPERLAQDAHGHGGRAHSLGLCVAELATLHGGSDPARAARDIAARFGYQRVYVHADTWALAVHRADPAAAATAVRTGNLLASARARHGAPTTRLDPAPAADFTDDLPPGGPLGDGWWATCAPAPYLARPAGTVGLGDTFVAGLLLAACIRAGVDTGGDPGRATPTNPEPGTTAPGTTEPGTTEPGTTAPGTAGVRATEMEATR